MATQRAESERDEVLALLRKHGGQPQSYFMLMPGLSYFLNASHTAVLAYRIVRGVAIVLRDPIGVADELEGLIASFRSFCSGRKLRLCFVAATNKLLPHVKSQGWRYVKIGEEALLELSGIDFKGKAWQDSRTALHRLPRELCEAQWYDLAADPQGWGSELKAISDQWLAQQRLPEIGFTMGTWEAAVQYASEQRLLVLLRSGKPRAFVTFIPCFVQGGGWSVDLMRRAGRLPAGAMEFLIATAIQTFKADGCRVLSLSLAPLADFTKGSEAGAPEPFALARQLVFQHLGQPYNFSGQARFKAKFQPCWEPRYLVYPRLRSLPRILLALLRAHQA